MISTLMDGGQRWKRNNDTGAIEDLRVVDRGLSLEQLAKQTGLSKSALGKYFKDITKSRKLQIRQSSQRGRSSHHQPHSKGKRKK